ncbi:hypothetical protein [Methyloglobulus sp.]|uniref:hypothetical protein n=1 Tax=Methyloglobulus sp. TaxID=2518622 RepID=UPI0032B86077
MNIEQLKKMKYFQQLANERIVKLNEAFNDYSISDSMSMFYLRLAISDLITPLNVALERLDEIEDMSNVKVRGAPGGLV